MTARAIAIPSYVLVPRPISSRMSSDRGVALWRIALVSIISTMKVDCPDVRSSPAPTRVKTRSTTPIRADDAGTKLPHCAISTISATWRRYVDFPAMFGPGEHDDLRIAGRERRVVRDERAGGERALDHRVAPVAISIASPPSSSGRT